VTALDEGTVGHGLLGGERPVHLQVGLVVVDQHRHLDALRPVVVGGELPVGGFSVRARRRVHRRRRHHRGHVDRRSRGRQRSELLALVDDAVDAEGPVGAAREVGVVRREQRVDLIGARGPGQEVEVAPAVVRVVRRPDDDVGSTVVDLGAGQPEQREVGAKGEGSDVHAGTVGEIPTASC
jgi:hypothetical protein